MSIITVSIQQRSFFCANVAGIFPRSFFSFNDRFEKYAPTKITMIDTIIRAKYSAKLSAKPA